MVSKQNKKNKLRTSILVAVVYSCLVCLGLSSCFKSPASTVEPTSASPIEIASSTPTSTSPADLASSTPTSQITLLPSNSPVPTSTKIVWTPLPSATALAAVLPSLTPETVQISGNAQISFIDVGQGDAILIRSPEGLFGLIDGGEKGSGVLQYFQSQGVQSLDLVVATHPHSDHIGGLIEVLNAIPTTRVVTNGEPHTTATYEDFLDAVIASKAEYIEVTRGDTIQLGSLVLDVLNPGSLVGDDLNRNSLVMRMAFGNTAFLFTGDANDDTEAEMVAAGLPLQADILKVGHHGSSTSTSSAFLSAVQPAVAVYSAGLGNSYGHPDSSTLNRLNTSGATTYGTDVNGTVIVEADGSGYTLQTEKQGQVGASPVVVTNPEPTAVPTSQPVASADVAITVVSLTSPISPGGTAQLTIQTAPGAQCTITVYYKSGASQAAGLGPQTADASGNATWSWKVGSRTSSGTWKIVVTANSGDKSATLEIPFVVE